MQRLHTIYKESIHYRTWINKYIQGKSASTDKTIKTQTYNLKSLTRIRSRMYSKKNIHLVHSWIMSTNGSNLCFLWLTYEVRIVGIQFYEREIFNNPAQEYLIITSQEGISGCSCRCIPDSILTSFLSTDAIFRCINPGKRFPETRAGRKREWFTCDA